MNCMPLTGAGAGLASAREPAPARALHAMDDHTANDTLVDRVRLSAALDLNSDADILHCRGRLKPTPAEARQRGPELTRRQRIEIGRFTTERR
jgi:hypothetical protein